LATCEYVPIPENDARKMLKAVNLKAGEFLIDLGSGTGEILIIAAEEFGARCMGIEVSRRLVDWTNEEIKKRNLQDKIKVFRGNFFSPSYWSHLGGDKHTIRKANVVTMYLTLQVQEALKKKLEKELLPGTRIASYAFKLMGWKPIKEVKGDEAPIFIFKKGKSF
jgi:tRNA A58 N-methylase Trm61